MTYDVMVERGLPSETLEIFVWLENQDLHFGQDWTWTTVPGSSFVQLSFYDPKNATMFALRWS